MADTIQAHNTFDNPTAVAPAAFTSFRKENDRLIVNLPAKPLSYLLSASGGVVS
uniref:hypothetical protein n=1 Tax=Paenibacillus roseopurpureus TaxID=2918901 RepID=UPI0037C50571